MNFAGLAAPGRERSPVVGYQVFAAVASPAAVTGEAFWADLGFAADDFSVAQAMWRGHVSSTGFANVEPRREPVRRCSADTPYGHALRNMEGP